MPDGFQQYRIYLRVGAHSRTLAYVDLLDTSFTTQLAHDELTPHLASCAKNLASLQLKTASTALPLDNDRVATLVEETQQFRLARRQIIDILRELNVRFIDESRLYTTFSPRIISKAATIDASSKHKVLDILLIEVDEPDSHLVAYSIAPEKWKDNLQQNTGLSLFPFVLWMLSIVSGIIGVHLLDTIPPLIHVVFAFPLLLFTTIMQAIGIVKGTRTVKVISAIALIYALRALIANAALIIAGISYYIVVLVGIAAGGLVF